MFEARNLAVNYGSAPALWDISLQVAPGELVCVVGPNGAGKSTLINAIVPEGRRLYTQMTVRENPELGSLIARAKPQQMW